MAYVLGIDLGTSSLKGLLMNEEGVVVASSSSSYPLIHQQAGYSEQDPAEWVRACETVLLSLKHEVSDFSSQLQGIAISGQMHGLVLLDEQKEVIRPAILWNDTRTTAQCERIMHEVGKQVVSQTKNIALEGFTLPKVLWVQEHESSNWEKTRHMMLPKDYLGFWLTGKLFTDKSDAAGTLMFDVERGEWAEDILEHFHIPYSYLPHAYHSTEVVGSLRDEIKQYFEFKEEVVVAAGGADNACAAVGSGILQDGVGMASIGTSGVFLSYETKAHNEYNGNLHLFNHGETDAFYSMGVTLAAGHSLNWFKETFANSSSFEELLSGVEDIPVGANGLLFTPYIVGERTPYADSKIRGSFIGMDTTHTLKHFARSVLEGITFSLKDSQRLMASVAGKEFDKIISVGGGTKNAAWLQMQADIFNASIVCPTTEQGPGQGAAMMAAVAIGWFATLKECAAVFVTYKPAIEPIKENVLAYEKVYKRYHKVYAATQELCHEYIDS